jgi:hypothetical protein
MTTAKKGEWSTDSDMPKAHLVGSATETMKRLEGSLRRGFRKNYKHIRLLRLPAFITREKLQMNVLITINLKEWVHSRDAQTGERNINWKGEKAGRSAIHHWVAHHKGKPAKCDFCGTVSSKQYEWSNKDHKYKRSLDDYIRLCPSCHRKNDLKFINYSHLCSVCGKKFRSKCKRSKYCSTKCKDKTRKPKK